jgi:lipoyl synthase
MKRLTAVHPETYAFSTTDSCSQQCDHCRGRFLADMRHEMDYSHDTYLISGGCDAEGSVMLDFSTLSKLRSLGKRINVHPGLVDLATAAEIGRYVEVVSFDFVSDDSIIRERYKLKKTEQDYVRSFQALSRHCRVVPHVLIGYGNEQRSLKMLKDLGAVEVCMLVMRHVPDGPEEPTLDEIESALRFAHDNFGSVTLGCMRPLDRKKEIDAMALKYVDQIVNPAMEIKGTKKDICCAFQ